MRYLTTCKITGTAKVRIGNPEQLADFEALKDLLLSKVAATETSLTVQNQLLNTKQGRKTIDQYADALKDLADRFAAATIKETTRPSEQLKTATTTLANKMALDAFKNGCHEESRLLVLATKPTTLEEAVESKKTGIFFHFSSCTS